MFSTSSPPVLHTISILLMTQDSESFFVTIFPSFSAVFSGLDRREKWRKSSGERVSAEKAEIFSMRGFRGEAFQQRATKGVHVFSWNISSPLRRRRPIERIVRSRPWPRRRRNFRRLRLFQAPAVRVRESAAAARSSLPSAVLHQSR